MKRNQPGFIQENERKKMSKNTNQNKNLHLKKANNYKIL